MCVFAFCWLKSAEVLRDLFFSLRLRIIRPLTEIWRILSDHTHLFQRFIASFLVPLLFYLLTYLFTLTGRVNFQLLVCQFSAAGFFFFFMPYDALHNDNH